MKRIVFLGIKHCGKSTQALLLARHWSCELLDTDELISQSYAGKYGVATDEASPRKIMQKHGEDFFRRFEADVIRELLKNNGNSERMQVIALGGGVPVNPFLADDELKKLGKMLYLEIDPATAFQRIAAGGIPPFLAGDDPEKKFMGLCSVRCPRYRQLADITINTDGRSADELSGMIRSLLGKEI